MAVGGDLVTLPRKLPIKLHLLILNLRQILPIRPLLSALTPAFHSEALPIPKGYKHHRAHKVHKLW
jgi:hypothetical protein